jgi:hypothetical protein
MHNNPSNQDPYNPPKQPCTLSTIIHSHCGHIMTKTYHSPRCPSLTTNTDPFNIFKPSPSPSIPIIDPCLQLQEHCKIEDFRCCWCSAPDVGEELELLGWCRGVDPVVLSTHQIVVRLWHFGERVRFQDLREAGSVKNECEEVKKTQRKRRDWLRIFQSRRGHE